MYASAQNTLAIRVDGSRASLALRVGTGLVTDEAYDAGNELWSCGNLV